MNFIYKFFYKISRKYSLEKFEVVPFQRNDLCYCDSGQKYKKCHGIEHNKSNKIACRLIDKRTKRIKIKVLNFKDVKINSNLTWIDVGVGSTGLID